MKTRWLLDQYMLDQNEQDILAALDTLGEPAVVRSLSFASAPDPLPDHDGPTVVYGSQAFVQKHAHLGLSPGAYVQWGALECSSYLSRFSSPDLFLNKDGFFLPWGAIKKNRDRCFDLMGSDQIFIRPNTGKKLFTGFVASRKDDWVTTLEQLHPMNDDVFLMLAPAQDIAAEYRCVVAAREMIGASRYIKAGQISTKEGAPNEVVRCVQELAHNPWQPDVVYVVDVALTNNGPKVIEINALSTSGLYMCPLPYLLEKISKTAQREYLGEIGLGDIPMPSPRQPRP